jgi:L-ascorbate metabolism protein UlaG (beta-lactamase superfamily)
MIKGARSGLSLVRKATHGEVTFHARPHCVAIIDGWRVDDKSLKTLGWWGIGDREWGIGDRE